MQTGNSALGDLVALIERHDDTAYLRATVTWEEGGWVARYLHAVVGAEPPTWKEERWDYPAMTFTASAVHGTELATALLDPALAVRLGDLSVRIPELQRDVLAWHWLPSRARRDSGRLPWPVTDWSLRQQGPQATTQWPPPGFLVGEDAPTFADYQRAHHAFYTGSFAVTGAPGTPTHAGTVSVVDRTAFLHRVRVSPARTEVEVNVQGTDPVGAVAQLVGGCGLITDEVGETGTVKLAVEAGISEDAWLYLVRGSRCHDYRILGNPLAWGDDITKQGVEFEVPDDPESAIAWLVTQGEGPQLEYKVKLPETEPERRGVAKTIAAMAMCDGGRIVFGVHPDEVTVVGLDVGVPLTERVQVTYRDSITQMARDRVTPTPQVQARWYAHEGKRLLVLDVQRGAEPPYAALQGGTPRYYVRHGSNDYPARPDEVRSTVARRLPQPSQGPPYLSPFTAR